MSQYHDLPPGRAALPPTPFIASQNAWVSSSEWGLASSDAGATSAGSKENATEGLGCDCGNT